MCFNCPTNSLRWLSIMEIKDFITGAHPTEEMSSKASSSSRSSSRSCSTSYGETSPVPPISPQDPLMLEKSSPSSSDSELLFDPVRIQLGSAATTSLQDDAEPPCQEEDPGELACRTAEGDSQEPTSLPNPNVDPETQCQQEEEPGQSLEGDSPDGSQEPINPDVDPEPQCRQEAEERDSPDVMPTLEAAALTPAVSSRPNSPPKLYNAMEERAIWGEHERLPLESAGGIRTLPLFFILKKLFCTRNVDVRNDDLENSSSVVVTRVCRRMPNSRRTPTHPQFI